MKTTALLITFLLFCQFAASVNAGKLYRWKDEQGNWILSDKVPPDQAKQERSELNERGRTIKIYEAAKTPAQIKKEAALKRLQKDKERILLAQQESDSVLLKTFQREQDVENALQAKLQTLDTRYQLARDQADQQEQHIKTMQKKAAEFERDGKAVPKKLLADIKTTQQTINDYNQQLSNITTKKESLKLQASADAKRLRSLQLSNSSGLTINQGGVAALELGKIQCSAAICDEVWSSAVIYARQFTNTRQLMESDNLLLTAPANTNDDFSVSLTRVAEDKGATIYMDIRCKDSEAGRSLCKSSQTLSILQQFGPKVTANLAVD